MASRGRLVVVSRHHPGPSGRTGRHAESEAGGRDLRLLLSEARRFSHAARQAIAAGRSSGISGRGFRSPCAKWHPTIFDSLKKCEIFIIIWCLHSSKSQWVDEEVQTAVGSVKQVIPVMIDRTPLPDFLAQYQGIDLHRQIIHSENRLVRAWKMTSSVIFSILVWAWKITSFIFPNTIHNTTHLWFILLYRWSSPSTCASPSTPRPLNPLGIWVFLAAVLITTVVAVILLLAHGDRVCPGRLPGRPWAAGADGSGDETNRSFRLARLALVSLRVSNARN